ncbi:MAG: DUF2877 domain-containing protein [candidate division Zixibacteria bacterium]|nr:DUF2877 domain-containing protein [candidate division Zixibacteria bacterium]
MRINRISRRSYGTLRDRDGYLGRIIKIWDRGFFTSDDNSMVLYFFCSGPLHVPFGLSLEGHLSKWYSATGIKEDDRLFKAGNELFLENFESIPLCLDPGKVVDLSRPGLYDDPEHGCSKERFANKIEKLKKAVLRLEEGRGLKRFLEEHQSIGNVDISSDNDTSLLSMCRDDVGLLIEGVRQGSLDLFERGYRGLIGKGPGLTPSGDDFLIGWLFGFYGLTGTLFPGINLEMMRKRCLRYVAGNTTILSESLIEYAFHGCFSELLHNAMESLTEWESDEIPAAVSKMLDWGGSSGVDTLTGLITAFNTYFGFGQRLNGE